MMSEYQKYPMTMTHPNYWPGHTPEPASQGRVITGTEGRPAELVGLPARFPPVTVKSPDDEEYYTSRGYVPSGNADPAAFSRAMAKTMSGYTPDEFPKWVGDEIAETPEDEARILGGKPKPVRLNPIEQLKAENEQLRSQVVTVGPQEVMEATGPDERDQTIANQGEQINALLVHVRALSESVAALRDAASAPPKPDARRRLHPGRGRKAWETRQARAAAAKAGEPEAVTQNIHFEDAKE